MAGVSHIDIGPTMKRLQDAPEDEDEEEDEEEEDEEEEEEEDNVGSIET